MMVFYDYKKRANGLNQPCGLHFRIKATEPTSQKDGFAHTILQS